MYNNIKYERKGNVGILTISRPEVLNALNGETLGEIDAKITEIEADSEVRALVITGEGRSFVAGADIAAQRDLSLEEGLAWGQNGARIFRRIELLPIPVIAAVNGFALGGGCELAIACDIVVGSTAAKFGQPEVGLGITPGFSGTQRLPYKVGKSNAMRLILSGEMIRADEAYRMGLINVLTEPEELMDKAMELAEKIIANAPLAVKYSKMAIVRGLETDLDSGIAMENQLFAMCFATEDQKEGMTAFLEKRDAAFKGE